MDGRLPLKDVLNRVLDDMNIVLRQLIEIVCVPRDQRRLDSGGAGGHHHHDITVSRLVELFKLKERELNEGMKEAAEQADRQALIEQLQEEMKKRDECIARISASFKDAEENMMSAIYQMNHKLKSMAEANRSKVSPEELIKYAHRISATNVVTAPLTWQQGDPMRPYPTEVEMWTGWPERMKERSKMEKDLPLASMASMGAPGAILGAGSQLSSAQHEFLMRPPQSVGPVIPPHQQIPSSPIGRVQNGWLSPRGGHAAQSSPRAIKPPTPSGGGQQPSSASFPRPGTVVNGLVGDRQQIQQQHSAHQQQQQQQIQQYSVKSEASSVPNSVEVVSSDSSSSSDSDSQ